MMTLIEESRIQEGSIKMIKMIHSEVDIIMTSHIK